jgi:hypothetical protein
MNIKEKVMNNLNPTPIDDFGAALAMAGLLVTSPVMRSWYRRWGASDAEVQAHLPGDEIVSQPKMEITRAITVQAPVENVWAWLAQIGQERGGLYSYERLENLARCQIKNADRIVPEWQNLEPGDNVRLGPAGYPLFRVVAVEMDKYLVMQACDPVNEQPGPASWMFMLSRLQDNETRLLTRSRNGAEWTFANRLMWSGIVDPLHFVMERRMLIGIKQRAEQLSL